MSFIRLLRLSLTRRPGKSLVVLLGFLLCWATLFALITLSEGAAKAAQESAKGTGHLLLVTPPVKKMNFTYGGVSIASGVTVEEGSLEESLLTPLKNSGTVLPKMVAAGAMGQTNVLVVGVNLQEEMDAKPHWRLKGELPREGFLLGAVAAEVLQAKKGDTLRIGLSNGAVLQGKVDALLEPTAGPEDQLVFTSLQKVQRALGKEGTLTFAELVTRAPIDEALRDAFSLLGSQAKVVAVQDAKAARMELADSLGRFTVLVGAVVLVLASSLLFITLWGAVQERQNEWGIFFALGFRPNRIKGLILSEGISLAALGALAGSLAGYALAYALAPWVSQEPLPLGFPLGFFVGGMFFAAVLALASAYVPAAKGASTDPVDSFRHI